MRIRRTGAKMGESPIWYVQADAAGERLVFLAGLLRERSPDSRYGYVLAWGFESREAAVKVLPALRLELLGALKVVGEQVRLAVVDLQV